MTTHAALDVRSLLRASEGSKETDAFVNTRMSAGRWQFSGGKLPAANEFNANMCLDVVPSEFPKILKGHPAFHRADVVMSAFVNMWFDAAVADDKVAHFACAIFEGCGRMRMMRGGSRYVPV